ncbi:MAG TPA: DUF4350 domain-containing protein [Cyanobacteria bacterium UBA8803]|nr:DUF4350 domain-containing protein [Cyanobacteria bacterium UBA9273]HBL61645.1 DUF4350 domain-containing protein [Cyanobacteria bacterium UBA8803]
MKLSQRQLWLFGAIAIGAIVLITLIAAPANNKLNSGSTYSRAPDGYGAWYAFMTERGTPIQRWQKPFLELAKSQEIKTPITLLRIHKTLTEKKLYGNEEDWVKKGNTLVILGIHQPVTEAPFSTLQDSPKGKVKIDTGRRHKEIKGKIVGDRFGTIIWQDPIGKGKIIYTTTPHLAANAYQNFPNNYELLAQLVTQTEDKGKPPIENQNTQNTSVKSAATSAAKEQNPVWVDEYIHGYKDTEVIKQEAGDNIFSYLTKKPLFVTFLQGLIILIVAIWASLRRFGQPVTLTAPVANNSEAYIRALAGVLQKAGSSEFILDVVGKEEQLQLQRSLGLGEIPLNYQSLVEAWVQQTGRPATELEQLLQGQSRKHRLKESNLLTWLNQWQEIRHHL